jgi:hypothetical protein
MKLSNLGMIRINAPARSDRSGEMCAVVMTMDTPVMRGID